MVGRGCGGPGDALLCRRAGVVMQGTAFGNAHGFYSTFVSPPPPNLGAMASRHGQE